MAVMRSDEPVIELKVAPADPCETGDKPAINMAPDVARYIERFASTDTSRELAGVLLGGLANDRPHPRVDVVAAITAKHTNSAKSRVTFTHETWNDINRVKDEQFPDLRIVGWFHTHPGFGIFLSGMDLFIQHHFFNLPWQIAYVVDPISRTSGLFRWEDGSVVGVDQTAEDTAQTSSLAGHPPHIPTTAPPGKARRYASTAAWFALGVAVGAAAVTSHHHVGEPGSALPPVNPVKAPVNNVQQPVALATDYVVQPGDTLSRIAEIRYRDARFAESVRILNRLADPNLLHPGDHLRLPSNDLAKELLGRKPASKAANP
ncbi:MAG TPA: LysM peptidoglycan-binding domain-containing protein [Armatimonadota bacterium]|jgi:proteasome lid subunit RPN8/RPN11